MSGAPKKRKEPFFTKGFWISLAISFFVASALSVLIGCIEWLVQRDYYPINALGISVDAVALSGILMALFFLLQYFSTKGAFDFLSYSLKVLIYTVFRPNYRKTGFPATYYDYKVLKDGENRKPVLAILAISLIFILAGSILYAIYCNQ